MKSFLITLFSFMLATASIAQDNTWKLYKNIDGVEIYTMESDCDADKIPAQKAIIIKVVNTTGDDLKVEWDKAIWYNDKAVKDNTTDDENHYTVEIEKNSSQEGTCDVPFGPFYIYKDFITYKTDTKLTQFELQNIKVTRL